MRLVFLYTQYGAADRTRPIKWDLDNETKNFFAAEEGGLRSEGYFWILKQLKEQGVFDEILIIIESNRSPGSTRIDGIPCLVLPLIDYIHDFLRSDDIIWVRGGFKTWYVHLESLKKSGHWLLLYAANTGRQRWKIWDVIFDDYIQSDQLDTHNRFWVKFNKPINPLIFKQKNTSKIYDVCVGASHIHDRKGQWRTIEALAYYKQARKRNLRAVMPGRFLKEGASSRIAKIIKSEGLDVVLPGMVPRPRICDIFNQSRVFVYLGEHGQNDRGPLEAFCCGTPIIIANPKYHQKEICDSPFCKVVKNTDYESVTKAIYHFLTAPFSNSEIAEYYEEMNGAKSVTLPKLGFIFKEIQKIGKSDTTELCRRLSQWVGEKGQK